MRHTRESGASRQELPATRPLPHWLLHHSHVLTITGESYRLREKRRAGVLNAPTAPATQAAS